MILTASEAESYNWFFEGFPLSFTSRFIEVKRNGLYSVEVTQGSDCQKTSSILVTNVNAENLTPLFQLFPNPTAYLFQLTSDTDLSTVTISIYNSAGQTVKSGQWNTSQYFISFVDVASLPPGLYTIAIRNNKKQWSKRMVKL